MTPTTNISPSKKLYGLFLKLLLFLNIFINPSITTSLVGFQFWESLNNKENLELLYCELTRASQVPPWYIDIKKLEKPEPLMGYDWS